MCNSCVCLNLIKGSEKKKKSKQKNECDNGRRERQVPLIVESFTDGTRSSLEASGVRV